jgi:hypothetical protein
MIRSAWDEFAKLCPLHLGYMTREEERVEYNKIYEGVHQDYQLSVEAQQLQFFVPGLGFKLI